MSASQTVLLDEDGVRAAVRAMARRILEEWDGKSDLILLGIQRRGVDLARMIREFIAMEGRSVQSGTLDITLYRDDLMARGPRPRVGETKLPVASLEGCFVVLVDDVIYSGRTSRAALNELMDWGRPARILLCALVDREGRELPIQPDISALSIRVNRPGRVDVRVPRLDGRLSVERSA